VHDREHRQHITGVLLHLAAVVDERLGDREQPDRREHAGRREASPRDGAEQRDGRDAGDQRHKTQGVLARPEERDGELLKP
jgi:hypothetical protein